MIDPPIEELLDRAGSKFSLVTLSAKRARNINSYFGHLGEGLGATVPPQVTSTARKPLSIAFEEIAADKIESVPVESLEDAEADADTDAGASE
jgi:DNA-directed RNA polymerase subunit omega